MKKWICVLGFLLLPLFCGCKSDNSSSSGGSQNSDPGNTASGQSNPTSTPTTGTCKAKEDQACFDITFTGLWTASSHPVDYPSNLHFSPLIGTTHNKNLTLWASDQQATVGIQSMAETGNTSQLTTEINDHKSNGTADVLVKGEGIKATGSTTVSIIASESFPLLSVTSMIAPSPDWFVGVSSRPLYKDGAWIDKEEISLDRIYDAGTDDGIDFTSDDAPANPRKAISRLLNKHFSEDSLPIAQLIIQRVK